MRIYGEDPLMLKFLHTYGWYVFLIGVIFQVTSMQGHTRV